MKKEIEYSLIKGEFVEARNKETSDKFNICEGSSLDSNLNEFLKALGSSLTVDELLNFKCDADTKKSK